MKTLKNSIIIFYLLVSFIGLAQTPDFVVKLQNSSATTLYGKNSKGYAKDIDGILNKFTGKWKYEYGNTSLEINVVKATMRENELYFEDELYVKFKYIENGVTIYDTNVNEEVFSNVIHGRNFNSENFNPVSLFYYEPSDISYNRKRNPANLELTYLPCGKNCTPQIQWHIDFFRESPDVVVPFKIPINLILTKVD